MPTPSRHISNRRSLVNLFRVALVFALLAASAPAAVTTTHAQRDDIERRVGALLARMTLEEKLGQLQQLDGHADGRFREEHVELTRKGLLGSTLNVRGAKQSNELQRVAVEQSRLKIPLIFGFDVIHGYRTIFPIPLG
ncbi:MAG TPA: glycoside hydrolase family 3 N-terminal domain-containing protein, partial [Pyrinomonadaceae bacterium]|nr:glycoside hydrolase family 3 N-terminal domain-containing protein [Pyrinomonadaceae bacterium]